MLADFDAAGRLIIWLAGLAVLALGGLILVHRLRIGLVDRGTKRVAPFSLEDLRRYRDRGDLSDAEYERLRQSIIDGTASGPPLSPAQRGL